MIFFDATTAEVTPTDTDELRLHNDNDNSDIDDDDDRRPIVCLSGPRRPVRHAAVLFVTDYIQRFVVAINPWRQRKHVEY